MSGFSRQPGRPPSLGERLRLPPYQQMDRAERVEAWVRRQASAGVPAPMAPLYVLDTQPPPDADGDVIPSSQPEQDAQFVVARLRRQYQSPTASARVTQEDDEEEDEEDGEPPRARMATLSTHDDVMPPSAPSFVPVPPSQLSAWAPEAATSQRSAGSAGRAGSSQASQPSRRSSGRAGSSQPSQPSPPRAESPIIRSGAQRYLAERGYPYVPPVVKPVVVPNPLPAATSACIGEFTSTIRGMSFYRHGGVYPDDDVDFVREPTNQHDANAIRVLNRNDTQVGHLAREHAAILAPLIDNQDATVDGVVLPPVRGAIVGNASPVAVHVYCFPLRAAFVRNALAQRGIQLRPCSKAAPPAAASPPAPPSPLLLDETMRDAADDYPDGVSETSQSSLSSLSTAGDKVEYPDSPYVFANQQRAAQAEWASFTNAYQHFRDRRRHRRAVRRQEDRADERRRRLARLQVRTVCSAMRAWSGAFTDGGRVCVELPPAAV